MALAKIFNLIGLKGKALPEDPEIQVLKMWIKQKYSNLTVEELVIAFELSLSGVVTIDVRHFNSFSVAYLSGIINAYLNHRKKVVAQLQRQKEKESLKTREMTDEQKTLANKTFDRNTIYKGFIDYKKERVLYFGGAPISHIYNQLEQRHGFFNFSQEEKKRIYIEQKDIVLVEINDKSKQRSTSFEEVNQKKAILRIIKNLDSENMNNSDKQTLKRMIQKKCHTSMITKLFNDWIVKNLDVELELKIK